VVLGECCNSIQQPKNPKLAWEKPNGHWAFQEGGSSLEPWLKGRKVGINLLGGIIPYG